VCLRGLGAGRARTGEASSKHYVCAWQEQRQKRSVAFPGFHWPVHRAQKPSEQLLLMRVMGRPPRLPFLRAAAALASLVTLPPFRPRATAAGFLRGIASYGQRGLAQRLAVCVGRNRSSDMRSDRLIVGMAQRLVFGHLATEVVGGEPVDLAASALGFREQAAEADGVARVAGAELVRRELCEEPLFLSHVRILPNRLGFVKW
jgi:hypothetical protein